MIVILCLVSGCLVCLKEISLSEDLGWGAEGLSGFAPDLGGQSHIQPDQRLDPVGLWRPSKAKFFKLFKLF